jgi:hypothetical protein
MAGDEVLGEVTSGKLGVDEMLDQFEEEVKEDPVENPKRISTDCKGNILTECIRDGLEEVERVAEETDIDYTIIGGIGTQLRGLADCKDILTIGDHFGRRQTADIDILVNNYSDGIEFQREYSEEGKPALDAIYDHIPGDKEVIDGSEEVYFGDIDERLDFTVSIPTNEDLIYTKVWNPSLEEREGTKYDLKKIDELNGYVFKVNEPKLREIVKERAPNTESAIDYLMRVGIDV